MTETCVDRDLAGAERLSTEVMGPGDRRAVAILKMLMNLEDVDVEETLVLPKERVPMRGHSGDVGFGRSTVVDLKQ